MRNKRVCVNQANIFYKRFFFTFIHVFLFLCNAVPVRLSAQTAAPVNVEMLGVNDGLSQSSVYSITQDSKGFIWIATFNGLDRYDGNGFLHFRHNGNDSFSLSSSQVFSVFEDSKQRLWIGTRDNGLNYFDKLHRRFYRFFPGRRIDKIVEDAAGNLYINDTKIITRITLKPTAGKHKAGLPFAMDTVSAAIPEYFFSWEGNFSFLFTDVYKNIYATTQNALYQIGFNEVSKQLGFNKLYSYEYFNQPPSFFQDAHSGKYYLLTSKAILESSNNRFQNAVKVHDGIPFCNNTFIDNASRLWYTQNEATHIFYLQTKQDKIFASSKINSGYQFGHLTPKLQDNNGTIWFSTASAGIIKYSDDENHFHSLLPGKYVGRVKIVNDSEFHVYNRYCVQLNDEDASVTNLSTDEVKSLNDFPFVRDTDGSFWHVTHTAVVQSDNAFRTLQTIPIPYLNYGPMKAKLPPVGARPARDTFFSTVDNGVILLDRDACLWFCSSDGFAYYDIKNHRFHYINKGKEFKKLYEDTNGDIWLGVDSGACRYNNKTGVTRFFNWKQDKNNQSLPDKNAISFCDDPVSPQRFIWIGTRNGLSKMDKRTGVCLNFYEKDGLPNNLIYDILPDDKGNLWMSSNKGLCRLQAADYSIRNFDVSDGLQGNEFNGGAAIKMKDGTLVFGGTNGITYFNPNKINDIAPPHTVITDYKVFGKSLNDKFDSSGANDVSYANDISISYDDNVLSFAFAGIDYRRKNALQYRYKLMGFDKDWNYPGTAHEATYTNLDPGDYAFVAEASNTHGVWGNESNALHVHVLPLWWQTIWFKLLSVLFMGALCYGIYRYRLQKALEVEKVRNRIARDLHDEIGSTLSAISIYSKVAHEQSKVTGVNPEPLLKKINENVLQVMDAMSDIVWSVNTKNDDFENIVIHMREHAVHLLGLKGYEVHFIVDNNLDHFNLKTEKRQSFYLIYKESLNNIAKYAQGNHVWIAISKEKTQLQLSVKDDGIGFNGNVSANRNGLLNMKNRAASVGGAIQITSKVGEGTEVCLRLPV